MTLVASLAVPAFAHASASDVIKDCAQDSKLDKHYSQADLAAARKQLPADVDEYTDCRDVIRRAQLGGGSGGGGGNGAGGAGGGGPTTPGGTTGGTAAAQLASATPEERAAIQKAVAGGDEPVQVGDKTLSPTSLGVAGSPAKTHDLPTVLILVLVLLGLSAAGAFGLTRRARAI